MGGWALPCLASVVTVLSRACRCPGGSTISVAVFGNRIVCVPMLTKGEDVAGGTLHQIKFLTLPWEGKNISCSQFLNPLNEKCHRMSKQVNPWVTRAVMQRISDKLQSLIRFCRSGDLSPVDTRVPIEARIGYQ
jgi:hypothetical protein